ncbi:hypothetical protein [Methyloterricola oryzae]|uniref:hypothetical protein n=1 Tax=Methyloterricola oryzae TaxID=1495050 RepID=UPI001F40F497|nr:hypothetical protein [Methyloterricola oryzae]
MGEFADIGVNHIQQVFQIAIASSAGNGRLNLAVDRLSGGIGNTLLVSVDDHLKVLTKGLCGAFKGAKPQRRAHEILAV